MITKRMINCDFFNTSGFMIGLTNKTKLLYFLFFTNADDYGFVGNGKKLAEDLDHCEETYENVLFQYKFIDALYELEQRRLVFSFVDKCNNKTYLIKHWFYHNKQSQYLSTNYVSLLEQVEIIDNEYQLKNQLEKKPLKENKLKENQIKSKSLNLNQKVLDIDKDSNSTNKSIVNNNVISSNWDKLLDDIDSKGE